jgi:Rab-GTPase-TBC domain
MFLSAELRQKAWPLLVGLQDKHDPTKVTVANEACIDDKDMELIRRDSGRSVLYRYCKRESPPSPRSVVDDYDALAQQDNLAILLETTIAAPLSIQQGRIHYYQGLHDVAGVLLFNMVDVHTSRAVMRRICQSHFRDALRHDFVSLTWMLDRVLLPLIQHVDQDVHDFLVGAQVEMSSGVLPWIITWFTHDIHKEEVASRLLDAFLCAHPMFPIYFAVALLTHPYNKQELVFADPDDDPAMVYITIRTFPSKIQSDWDTDSGITAQDLLDDALHIMREVPPRALLKLASAYDVAVPMDEVIDKASCLSIMRAPPSWALSSTAVVTLDEEEYVMVEGGDEEGWDYELQDPAAAAPKRAQTNKAKIASGVAMIMKTVPFDATLSLRVEEENPREWYPKTFQCRSKWGIYRRMLFGRRH